ncbi:MAG: hypothetical protein J7639_11725 [Paenibacillaceae bacterium]|nr:hypothetical protein [Paenibacillaceae bacterium]
MQYTSNLNLKKPESSDAVNIDDLNGNADLLDAAVAGKVDKVAGKGLSTEDYTTAEKSKLAGVAAGAQVNAVTSVAGRTGAVTLAVGDVAGAAPLDDYIRQPGFGTTGGSANTYSLTLSPALASYAAGVCVAVKINVANTGSSTLNVNGLGAKTIKDSKGNNLTSGKLVLGSIYTLRYDGANFILQGEGGEYGTAVAADVLSGKTVGTDAGLVAGTMINRSTGDYSSSSQSVSGTMLKLPIPENAYYGTGANVTRTDANFVAGNILSGKSIFGVAGSLIVGKKWAQGSATSSSMGFISSLGAYGNGISVSGLAFKPTIIITVRSGSTFLSSGGSVYVENLNGQLNNGGCTTFTMGYSEGLPSGAISACFNITTGSFTVICYRSNSPISATDLFNWIAVE